MGIKYKQLEHPIFGITIIAILIDHNRWRRKMILDHGSTSKPDLILHNEPQVLLLHLTVYWAV